MVVPGDEVHVRGGERERIVVMQWTVVKRVGTPVAVTCYLDRSSPAPAPKEHIAAGTRDRGAGRSTKRDRPLIERLRGH